MILGFLNLFSELLFILILVGIILTTFLAFKKQGIKKGLFVLFIPFYIIPYLLKMQEGNTKKILSTLVLGCLVLFILIYIIDFVFTPPI